MSWFKNLFVSKERRILRAKAKDFFEKFCFALECFGEVITYSEEVNAERLVGLTQAGSGQIRIRFYHEDGHIEVSIPLIEGGFNSGMYQNAYLGKRRCYCNMFFPNEINQADPIKFAQEFHELSVEFIKVIGEIEKIQGEALEQKNEIDSAAKEEKAKIDTVAKEQISKLRPSAI